MSNGRNTIKKSRVHPLSETEEWKLNIIEELSLVNKGQLNIDDEFDEDMLEEIIYFICTQ